MSRASIDEHDVWFTNRRGQRIVASVTRPSTRRAAASVLLVHGLGGHRNEPHVVTVAHRIAEYGMTALRVDLANNAGESGGAFRALTLSGEVDDAEDALQALLAMDGSAQPSVGAAGHSFGGLVAMLLAARRPEVRSLVLMSAVFDAPSRLQSNFAARVAEWRERGQIEFGGGRLLGIGFLDDLSNWDVRSAARILRAPTLIVHGESDDEVAPSEALEYQRHLASTRREVRMIAGADHTYTQDAWRKEVADAAAAWFSETLPRKQLAPKAGPSETR